MPYFSFSLKKKFILTYKFNSEINISKLENNIKYFSKNTKLWKLFNDKKFSEYFNFIQYEKRNKINSLGKNILFCLPPSIGLGDSIEYAKSIKSIIESKKFKRVGVAFVGKYSLIFRKYFQIDDIYEEFISERSLNLFDSVFHLTLEIDDLTNQKYQRADIEKVINSYFNVKKFEKKHAVLKHLKKKLSLFPISSSPIRTMPIYLINHIIKKFEKKIKIEIILDRSSDMSNLIEKNLYIKDVEILNPTNVKQLISIIEKIYFGIFMDSGPLHMAKLFNKKGVLITSSVGQDILLNKYDLIKSFNNNYSSDYCSSPCGLVDLFSYENKIGCYDSIKIKKNKFYDKQNLFFSQRGISKKKYVNFISNPVNCLKNIEKNELVKMIEESIN